jgi:hypothetical protein
MLINQNNYKMRLNQNWLELGINLNQGRKSPDAQRNKIDKVIKEAGGSRSILDISQK